MINPLGTLLLILTENLWAIFYDPGFLRFGCCIQKSRCIILWLVRQPELPSVAFSPFVSLDAFSWGLDHYRGYFSNARTLPACTCLPTSPPIYQAIVTPTFPVGENRCDLV